MCLLVLGRLGLHNIICYNYSHNHTNGEGVFVPSLWVKVCYGSSSLRDFILIQIPRLAGCNIHRNHKADRRYESKTVLVAVSADNLSPRAKSRPGNDIAL